jgi:hypothetical protein
VPGGTYPAEFVGLEAKESRDGNPYYRWKFEATTATGIREVSGISSQNTGPQSKAYRWLSGLLARRGFGLGREVGAALGLRGESVAARLGLAWAAGVGLALGAEAGAEQAAPMMTIATIAAATGKSEKRGLRIRVSFVLIGRGMGIHVRLGNDTHETTDRPRCCRPGG